MKIVSKSIHNVYKHIIYVKAIDCICGQLVVKVMYLGNYSVTTDTLYFKPTYQYVGLTIQLSI